MNSCPAWAACFVPYSPLGHGFLTGAIRSPDDLSDDDCDEENTAADHIELSAEQIERLNNLTPAAGERDDEGNMAAIDR